MKRIKVKKERNFTVINNEFIFEKKLSLKAKGLLVWMLALPENWELYVENIVTHHKDGKTAVYSALKELMDLKYLERKQVRDKKGKIMSWEYVVYEKPQHSENLKVENLQIGLQDQENKSLINKKTINKIINKVIYPSELNIEAWELWKQYRKEQFKSKYKPIGEKAAIKKIIKMSNNDMKIQADIIQQSIENGWRGLFDIKETKESNVKTLQNNWIEARKMISNG